MGVLSIEHSNGLILDQKNRMLLQRKDEGHFFRPNFWCLFGGGVKGGESPLEAFLRESKNENGLVLSDVKFFCKKNFSDIAKVGLKKDILKRHGKINYFAARFDGNLSKIRVGEGAGFSVFEEEEIKKYNQLGLVVPYNYEIIEKFYKKVKEGVFNF